MSLSNGHKKQTIPFHSKKGEQLDITFSISLPKRQKRIVSFIYIYIYNLTLFEDVMSAIHARRYSPVTDISRAGRTCLAYTLAFNLLLSLLFILPSPLSFPAGVSAGILLNIATHYRVSTSAPPLKSYTGCRIIGVNPPHRRLRSG